MKNNLKIGIIGAGLIGTKRAAGILELGKDKIVAIADVNLEKAKGLADTCKAKAFKNRQDLLKADINAVIVATTTDVNSKIVAAALKAGKHVLAEKPLGKNSKEAVKLAILSAKAKKVLKVGFNHRHHPAIMKAYELYKAGKIGKILFIRSVYGHGARPGYDTEWRMQKKYSLGGELFDQGVHIIDLANWFLGGFAKVFGQTRNFYWKKSPLEDNAFCQLQTSSGQIVDFHVSLTQWRNRFNFEIYGDEGYLIINGKGGAYGMETLTLGTKVGLGQVPKEEKFEFTGADVSWKEEWIEFRNAVLNKRQPLANGKDNIEVNKILEGLYLSAKKNQIINL